MSARIFPRPITSASVLAGTFKGNFDVVCQCLGSSMVERSSDAVHRSNLEKDYLIPYSHRVPCDSVFRFCIAREDEGSNPSPDDFLLLL